MSYAPTLERPPAAATQPAPPRMPKPTPPTTPPVSPARRHARLRADIVNLIVLQSEIVSAIELGCGDGRYLDMLHIPQYLGFESSETALEACRKRHASDDSKRFLAMQALADNKADLVMSFDVLQRLTDTRLFASYMNRLFDASRQLVLIQAPNPPEEGAKPDAAPQHRTVTGWIARHRPDFVFLGAIETGEEDAPELPPGTTQSQFMLFCRDRSAARH